MRLTVAPLRSILTKFPQASCAMDDLEETIFQRNVPGKYSRWEGGERSDVRAMEDDNGPSDEADDALPVSEDAELMKYAEQLSRSEVPEPIRQRILAERMTKSATGVKGVLADYKAAQAMAEAEAHAEALNRQQIITRMVEGAKVKTVADTDAEMLMAELDALGEDSDDFDDEDGDDAFMREFRAKRLQELKANQQTAASNSSGSDNAYVARTFGAVREIRTEDFLHEVDAEDPRVTVVVHLYEPAVQGCVRMNSMLDEIAAALPHMKFLRMQASSNEITVDRVALPILTLYRAGQEVSTLAGIAADFGQYFKKEDIVWLLETATK